MEDMEVEGVWMNKWWRWRMNERAAVWSFTLASYIFSSLWKCDHSALKQFYKRLEDFTLLHAVPIISTAPLQGLLLKWPETGPLQRNWLFCSLNFQLQWSFFFVTPLFSLFIYIYKYTVAKSCQLLKQSVWTSTFSCSLSGLWWGVMCTESGRCKWHRRRDASALMGLMMISTFHMAWHEYSQDEVWRSASIRVLSGHCKHVICSWSVWHSFLQTGRFIYFNIFVQR